MTTPSIREYRTRAAEVGTRVSLAESAEQRAPRATIAGRGHEAQDRARQMAARAALIARKGPRTRTTMERPR